MVPLALLIGTIAATVGCAQARYTAASLPSEYAAPHHVSARHVDLSTMPRQSIPTEWLQPGDSVEVSIATGIEKGPTSRWKLRLDNTGRIDVPLVGSVPVAGVTANVAAERIRDESIRRGLYLDPKVTVSVDKKRVFQVSVVGAVNAPDTYEIPAANCDLLTALTTAKGVSDEADRTVEIRHSPDALAQLANTPRPVGPNGVALASYEPAQIPSVVNLDLADLQSYPPGSLKLFDGSVVSVARQPKRTVSVMGLVQKPQQIEMPEGEDLTLLSAVAQAGGTSMSIADKALVIRQASADFEPIVIEASLRDARYGGQGNLRLAPGDIVSVEETATTMVVQAVRSFFRVGFSAAVPGF